MYIVYRPYSQKTEHALILLDVIYMDYTGGAYGLHVCEAGLF